MSWINENPLTYFQSFCSKVLKCGPIPRHVAIIMDGNRRFARKTNVEKSIGHSKGFEKLADTLQWCREIGINEVTVYAFSIENFKRSSEEVETLMQLSREKFKRLLEEKDKLKENGVSIRVIGNLSLLPDDIRSLIAKAILMTQNNNKFFLNVAFAYTSRDEITNAIKTVVNGVHNGLIEKKDIDEELLTKCMYTSKSPDPDLYIRTSGEVRFSDFLLWQNSNSVLCFVEVLWPEFSFWHLLKAVFYYQRHYIGIPDKMIYVNENPRKKDFLKFVEDEKIAELKMYSNIPINI
ncbi:dehydrodolichyl diphosphate synthase complex subunit DHDDS [Agrilus planipennis]|uniref:Alkyl transferase n=1 Tax=Agrilus planipennis TaxID=224129 RepID=A0A1W4WKN9_AGRPL|nr:dehydrodolichyl diphosphate synthase complex subunit DHDDS [Agrilus planipennis]